MFKDTAIRCKSSDGMFDGIDIRVIQKIPIDTALSGDDLNPSLPPIFSFPFSDLAAGTPGSVANPVANRVRAVLPARTNSISNGLAIARDSFPPAAAPRGRRSDCSEWSVARILSTSDSGAPSAQAA